MHNPEIWFPVVQNDALMDQPKVVSSLHKSGKYKHRRNNSRKKAVDAKKGAEMVLERDVLEIYFSRSLFPEFPSQ